MSVTRKKKRSSRTSLIFAVILALVGFSAVLYPLVSTLHNNVAASRVADQARTEVDTLDDDYKRVLLDQMRAYNASLISNPIDPGVPDSQEMYPTDEYRRYLDVGRPSLASTDVISEIIIPDVSIKLPVYRGSGPSSLNRGAGHLFGTTLPVGGSGSNTTITAHTGMATATMFDNLINLKEGQDIYVSTMGEMMRYRMVGSKVVPPEATDAIPMAGEADTDRLFLITCTPYGLNFHRLIVEAHRIPLDADPAPDNIDDVVNEVGPWQWWMTVTVVVTVVILLLFGFILWNVLRKKDKGKPTVSGRYIYQ